MRMVSTHYGMPMPALVKRTQASQVKHVSAPLKGLSLSSKLTPGDPLTATILKNFVIEDDRIDCRAGHVKQATLAGGAPVAGLIPFYGSVPHLAAASNHRLFNAGDGTLLQSGLNSDDWSWTAYANLGTQDYTIMCNGVDGVWSWDGGLVPQSPLLPIYAMTQANPAVATVAAADMGYYHNGATVEISGATGSWAFINGSHTITSVNVPVNTVTLAGLDTTGATGAFPAGVFMRVEGSFRKETITAPADATWVTPDQFQFVLNHMNRLWFADNTNLAVYYLPLQQMSGELEGMLPLNALFKRGGAIKAMYTWTVDGGISMNDQLVIFTTNGECAIYQGTNPEADFQLAGIFRFDPPMSKHCVVNYGGDLYVLVATGVVPLSTLLRSEDDQLGKVDRSVISIFNAQSVKYRDRLGWQLMLNPSSGRLIANMPDGAPQKYTQMIRHMPRPVWSQWVDLPARCWAWIDPYLYFGDDLGNVYRMHPAYLNDDGQPIRVDVQMAWSQYGTPAVKHFKMIQPYMTTDGDPRPYIDVKVDYDYTEPTNQPDVTFGHGGAIWDTASWNDADWALYDARPIKLWQGVGVIGRVGGPRMVALLRDCKFGLNGWDVVFEGGALVG